LLGAALGLLALSAPAGATTLSFSYTAAEQTFTVPAGVYSVHVLAVGANGAASAGAGGAGAQVNGDLEVTPGETLYVEVGGSGSGATGGFNGGANGSAGGGGASDVRTVPRAVIGTLEHRLVVAGGGGGGGGPGESAAGAGGAAGSPGTADGEGLCEGGLAGKANAGGAGGGGSGAAGSAGTLGAGGEGGVGVTVGGGGGGGVYGGGGGGGCLSLSGGGGGGGSSVAPPGGSVAVAGGTAVPQVQISYVPPQEFGFTGGEQTFTVPAGVTSVHVVAVGGRGGSSGGVGGAAAQASGNLTVTPGQTLYLEVGGNGRSLGGGGFNGGAAGAAGGGGASDVRTVSHTAASSLEHRLLVASGGGGGGALGESAPGTGGSAGSAGTAEGNGFCEGGGAGKSNEGGAGGGGDETGAKGALGVGGAGGVAVTNGGGGGGGLYGGGGGGACFSFSGGGGGGGSSLVPAGGSLETALLSTSAEIQISYTPPSTTIPISSPGPGPAAKSTPVISGVSESAKSWRESNALVRVSIAKKRAPVGTTFSFTLDQAASVTFAFKTKATGRKVKGKCVAQTRSDRHKPACSRTILAGTFVFAAHAGTNRVRFAGRISASRKLPPGRYTLEIVAVNNEGKASAPQTLTFTIVK